MGAIDAPGGGSATAHDDSRQQPGAADAIDGDRGLITLLFESIDARDADAFLDHLTSDARFVFGNAPPAVGRAAVGAMVRGFFQSIHAGRHEVHDAFRDGGTSSAVEP